MNKMTLEIVISHSNTAMRFAKCNQIPIFTRDVWL